MVNSRKEIKFRRLTIWHILRGENILYATQGRSIKLLGLQALLVIRGVGIRILDPYLWLSDPVLIRMRIRNTGTFTSFFTDKKLERSYKTGFSYYSASESVLVTNGSGCGSGIQKT